MNDLGLQPTQIRPGGPSQFGWADMRLAFGLWPTGCEEGGGRSLGQGPNSYQPHATRGVLGAEKRVR